jgi:hypothetical protein|tara:strand:+ start:1645 stop:1968 length:324 start_codon:yes stop_codon:yes gene_type:complete
MKIIGTKTFNLLPIGNLIFTFNRNVMGSGNPKFMWVGEVTIMHETKVNISDDDEKALFKLMGKKSALLTDGKNFYTTTGKSITQIAHTRFIEILDAEKERVQEYFNS